MKTYPSRILLVFLLVGCMGLVSGCGGKKWYWPFGSGDPAAETQAETPAPEPVATPVVVAEPAPEVPPVSDPNARSRPSTLPLPETASPSTDVTGTIPPPEPIRKAGALASELEMVHFDYDKSDLRPDALPILDRNAEWLLQHPGLQVQIEGHCDERGTIEYNLALGQRRAESVREYLIKKGVDANIIHTISYGKERPLAFGDSDADHNLNRRAQFLVFTQ